MAANELDLKKTSALLKQIGGVVLVQSDLENHLYSLDNLVYSNKLSTGQIFNAVRILYGKEISDYGPLWPKFRNDKGEISNEFVFISNTLKKCKNDQQRILRACDQLKEEHPEILPVQKVQENLETLKGALNHIANQ